MTLEVEATYENGVLKLDNSLPLDEHERVTVQIKPRVTATIRQEKTVAELAYGLIGWTGDPGVVRRIALEPEFGIQESP